MTANDDIAGEARAGLAKNLVGKAKEAVGAVLGRNDLVAEGRLNQAEAQERKEAATQQALAEAEFADGEQALATIAADADTQEAVVRAHAARVAEEADREAAARVAVAQEHAAADEALAKVGADIHAGADLRRVQAEATRGQLEAERLEAAGESDYAARAAEAERSEDAAARAREAAERLDRETP
ncbi:hypothetical protein [Sporichthya sp.]|uniref:hypothetical protein n=1 Tax=Sporichthya sp. TaxID=65475 RepID=UPI00181E9B33|nr:hypothetical protein [Sporichthya sp.]MBA3745298.1 hypothetical protein [Sporichthya sp.]